MKISVITVCRNAAPFLAEAMTSVLAQSWADLEYVLVDGASTDGSVELIRDFALQDARIHWSSEPDQGIAAAMNKGLARTNGQIVAFLNADDSYADVQVLERVAATLTEDPQALWVTGGLQEIDAHGKPLRRIGARRFSRCRLLRNNILFHPATFVRREAFALVGGFNPDLRYAMDYDLWLRLARIAPPRVLAQTLANFRVHAGSISSANRRAALEEEYQVRCLYLRGSGSRLLHGLYHRWRCWRADAH